MWRAFEETGRLQFPGFIETTMKLMPMYWVRAAGGTMYLIGMVLLGYNVFRTWRARPARYGVAEVKAPALARVYAETPGHAAPVPAGAFSRFTRAARHRTRGRLPGALAARGAGAGGGGAG